MSRDTMTMRSTIAPPSTWQTWGWHFAQGTACGLYVKIIGSLSLLEVYLLATLPARLGQFVRCASTRGVVLFTILWIGWIAGAVMADLVNGTQWSLAARGIARAFFAGFVTLCLIPIWMRSPRAFEAFLAGSPVAQVIGLKYFRSGTYNTGDGTAMIDASVLGWDSFGNYVATAAVAFLIARHWRRHPWACAGLALGLGAVNIALGSRAAGITQIAAGAVMPIFILQPHFEAGWWSRIGRLGPGRLLVAAVIGVAALAVTTKSYSHLARSGVLGEKAKIKYEAQISVKGGIIAGGRSEFLIGLAAVLDKPLTGHGSWPEDTIGYAERASERFGVEIREPKTPKNFRKFIKAHSAIVGAWVDHGILAAVFWLYVFYLVATNFWRVTQYLPDYTGVVIFNCCGFFWHFFFSPIQSRGYTAILLVPILIIQIKRLQAGHILRHPGRVRSVREPHPEHVAIPA